MKVLTVIYNLDFGGTQRAAVNFALGAKEFNLDSAVYVYKGRGPREAELVKKNINIMDNLNGALDWKPDIVHIFRWGNSDLETANILREFKKVNSKTVETNVFSFADYSDERQLIDLHFHMTPWCLWKWWNKVGGLKDQSPGCVVPFIVNEEPFYPSSESEKNNFRMAHGIPADAFLMGRVGQPSMGKWNANLITEFNKISQKYSQAFLLVVGLPRELKEKVTNPKIIQIDFLKTDEELRLCYGAMDVFLHSSKLGESFGMVLAEALLCQTPVVTQSTPRADNSQIEIVEHLKNGVVARTSNRLSEGVELLINNPELKYPMGVYGRNMILDKYTSKKVFPKVIQIFEVLLNSKGPSDLKRQLCEGNIKTEVTNSEIIKKYQNSFGPFNLKDYFYMCIPKAYHFLKGRK